MSSLYLPPQGGVTQAKTSPAESSWTGCGKVIRICDLRPEHTNIGGQPALVTRMTTTTSSQQDPAQVILHYTAAREAGIWSVALAAPSAGVGQFEPVFQQM